jgi:DNA polymerase-1
MVVRIIAGVWFHGPYDGLLVGFDHPVNHRKLADAGYKAGRAEKDDELRAQLAAVPGHLADCGFTVEQHEGAEADDVLASAAVAATAGDIRLHVLSSDKDLLALVSDTVTLLRPRGSMHDTVVTDPDRVRSDHGVDPGQYTDLAALRGDPSDGLRGCHGIGRRTAARLLRDHGSVEELYANLHNLDPRTEAKLRAGRDEVDRNLALMSPLNGVPADVTGATARGIDLGLVDRTLGGLGLGRAAGALRHAVTRPALPPLPPPPGEPPPEVAPPRARPIEPVDARTQDALF